MHMYRVRITRAGTHHKWNLHPLIARVTQHHALSSSFLAEFWYMYNVWIKIMDDYLWLTLDHSFSSASVNAMYYSMHSTCMYGSLATFCTSSSGSGNYTIILFINITVL